MTKAIDILAPSNPGVALASDPLLRGLNIGKSLRNGDVNHGSSPPVAHAASSKMTHLDESHCPKCHAPMEPAFIGQEEVFFCPKHAVTLPKSE